MNDSGLAILSVMGLMLIVMFFVSWIAVRSAREDRRLRDARPYSQRH